MSYSTRMWALATFALVALLMFAGTEIPRLGHETGGIAAAASTEPVVFEQNLHTNPGSRFERTIEAFAPLLALLFVTLVVLDSIAHKAALLPADAAVARTPDFAILASNASALDEWPREFDLVVEAKGWIAVRHEPQLARYRGN